MKRGRGLRRLARWPMTRSASPSCLPTSSSQKTLLKNPKNTISIRKKPEVAVDPQVVTSSYKAKKKTQKTNISKGKLLIQRHKQAIDCGSDESGCADDESGMRVGGHDDTMATATATEHSTGTQHRTPARRRRSTADPCWHDIRFRSAARAVVLPPRGSTSGPHLRRTEALFQPPATLL